MAWKMAIVLRKETAPSAFLRLPKDWNLFLDSLSSKHRRNIWRRRKHMEKLGRVKVRILSPSRGEYYALLEDALQVEDKSWKGHEGSSLLKNTELFSFFQSYLSKACDEGILRFCFIDIDGKPVSMQIAIETDVAFWGLKIGYDESMAKYSPGAQLSMDTIAYCVEKGLARYEFLGSVESWQQAWPIEKHSYFTVLLYPFSLRGLLGLFGFATMYLKNRL
jgi:CelD/BcsL family acetyltransferase involved in cellulose biosynthesis